MKEEKPEKKAENREKEESEEQLDNKRLTGGHSLKTGEQGEGHNGDEGKRGARRSWNKAARRKASGELVGWRL